MKQNIEGWYKRSPPYHTLIFFDLAEAINVTSNEDPLAENSEEFLELANGCLCCSIKDAGIAAIEKLMERRGAFDHIILETTGLADPGENHPYLPKSNRVEP